MTPYDTQPAAALDLIAAFDGPVLVDLDETLYLQNSTEDFIDCAQPGLIALLVMRACDILKPWRWTGGAATRDAWRVRLIGMLFPWIWSRWRSRVERLAGLHLNRELHAALSRRATPPVIATVGFRRIVEPLIAAMGYGNSQLIAVNGSGFTDRRAGKLALVTAVLDAAAIKRALLITDSSDDLPLLAECACGLRTVWPLAFYRPALSSHVYLPGQYLTLVKRPGERYIWRGIVQEDFAFWILGSVALAASPLLHLIGLSLLLLSFWIIYERGYVDNDQTGARFETSPKLSAEFARHIAATPPVEPWIWALLSGAAAIYVLRLPGLPSIVDFVRWYSVLAGTYLCFSVYNRLDKDSRVWLYAVLQFARAAALAAVVPITLTGTLAIAANTLTRWMPYYFYRRGKQTWPEGQFQISRLLFLVVLVLAVALGGAREMFHTATLGAIMVWAVFRARKELYESFAAAKRIDRPSR